MARSFILWLHGLGDSGPANEPIKTLFSSPQFKNTLWSFPSAPSNPVTCNYPMMMVTLIWVFVGCLIWNALKQIRISKYKIDVNDYDTYRERQKELKKYEAEDRIRLPNIIVVQINGRNFRRFSEDHNFKLPFDENAMNLMKACAVSMLEKFPDIIFSYGFDDEYSFVFRRNTKFYQRRASKLLSVITSSFMSEYVFKWEEFFPTTSLAYSPSFCGRILACASIHVLQQYLSWRQYNCANTCLDNTVFWSLLKQGKTEAEARDMLKGTQKRDKRRLLHLQLHMNYNDIAESFRFGSCTFKTEVDNVVKYCCNGSPVIRMRRKAITTYSRNIAGANFWNEKPLLVTELGAFVGDVGRIITDYVRSLENKLMPNTWIAIRIDGCHFHRFTEIHGFEKPNDEQGLKLMNSCAVALLEEFQDIIFAYGFSDEYSFVLNKNSQFLQRQSSDIVSTIVSSFTSAFLTKWKVFFPLKKLIDRPSFDGRVICYPSCEVLRLYLALRQVDAHVNNQYNTCFWMLVKSGKKRSEAQHILKGTRTPEKLDLLAERHGIEYKEIKEIFRFGSSVFRVNENTVVRQNGASNEHFQNKVVVDHCNIIDVDFWDSHPGILGMYEG